MEKLLEIKDLSISFGEALAVDHVSLTINEEETLALVGESGSGKTVLCKTILRLINHNGINFSGSISLQGQNLLTLKEEDLRTIRGRDIALVFQDPMTSLNPTFSVGAQIMEAMRNKRKSKEQALKLLELVGIDKVEKRFSQYPHEFSGGMRQRVAIAIALASDPKLLIVDEPTTALDKKNEDQIIRLLQELKKKLKMAILFVTHDLRLVEHIADCVVVMQGGKIIERGAVSQVFQSPKADYTKKLLGFLNYGKGEGHTHGEVHFHDGEAHAHCNKEREKLLEVKNLYKYFCLGQGKNKALEDFSMEIFKGEIVGLVGPSGCGKSTLARCIMHMYKDYEGEICFFPKNLNRQMIFQDSASAFNSRMTISQIIGEPLVIQGQKKDLEEKVYEVMEQVGLGRELADRHPYDVSGGQRQRAAIGRALIMAPEFIIADEPISSLDVSIQAQIVHLLKELQEKRKLTILFIAHDLPMVNHISDRVIFMKK